MIVNDKRLVNYLNGLVNSFYKILPLYEEENEGLRTYVNSLIFELSQLDSIVTMNHSYEYISILTTLKGIESELKTHVPKDSKNYAEKHKIIRREVFKSIDNIKTIVESLEGDANV